jgi:hypothetical protein
MTENEATPDVHEEAWRAILTGGSAVSGRCADSSAGYRQGRVASSAWHRSVHPAACS